MTVSACLIVKNEEAVLARAIDCFKGLVDEIVVVDTGSADNTKNIALGFTDKVFDYAWHDDFSAARNFAFSKCTMDYIYSADADEVIDDENQRKLKALLAALPDDVDVVQMHYTNQTDNGSVYNFDTEYRPKLFRRLRPFRWIDPVHETVDTQVRVLNSDIAIIHRPAARHSKRDFSIFRRVAQPGAALSPRLHRLYAQELFLSGDEEDFLGAYDYFEWTLHEEGFGADTVRQSQCVAAKCCFLKKDDGGLFKAALKNVVGKPSAEVSCVLGDHYFDQNDYEEAATWYYTAAFGAECELSARAGGAEPLAKLSECYRLMGFQEDAEKYKKLAGDWSPGQ
ncbi:Glycosyltransferase involved in cell wall bisynthesis [Sporobacter termitidis DSM 10068]|uniref:Glycosyltransferase involved in cell wall bisynthesis n=1 Tax=Sporobacter termitidis DSM 10068 TaxID=1123282 RepID=A0A1M5VML3_9FIRM|nr:glycosyltransferase family 2 protein [Sporobacter termitidis]SHH76467.1 Glycosyltransferase involved in cell wall bisynthesis [Sporobacter termitidis DSM 10068]